MEGSRIRLAGPHWKGGSPKGDEGSTPLPSARRPDGETEDHASLRTRRSGFESWSGCLNSPVVQWAGHSRDMEKIAGSNPAGTIDGVWGVEDWRATPRSSESRFDFGRG
jgi:hypothetical protein